MKTIHCTIKGAGLGILLHNPAGMGGNANGKKVIPTPEQEARAGCYFMEDGETLAIPSWNLFRCITKAASGFKSGKTSGSKIVAGGVSLEPAMLSFSTKVYGIYTTRAVVQRQGILRSRPHLKTWKLDFDMLVDDTDVDAKFIPLLRAVVEDAGRKVGLGDFRIEKSGPFGKFAVEKWEVA